MSEVDVYHMVCRNCKRGLAFDVTAGADGDEVLKKGFEKWNMKQAYGEGLWEAVEQMRNQLLIVMVNRLGGEVKVPVKEIDGTGAFIMEMMLNGEGNNFTFKVVKKQ